MDGPAGEGFLAARLKLRHLRLTVALAQAGTLTRAAADLRISQAAASKTLSEIEHLLGLAPFERAGNRWLPTAAGAELAATARRILAEIERLDAELRWRREGTRGTVAIGVHAASGQDFFVAAGTAIKAAHPHLTLRIAEGLLPRLLEDLRAGALDLVFGRISPELLAPDLEAIGVAGDTETVIASLDHPLAGTTGLEWKDVVDEAWCLPLPGTPSRETFERALAEQGLAVPADRIEVNSTLTLALMARRPLLALVPCGIAERWIARQRAIPLSLPPLPAGAPIGLIWPRETGMTSATRLCRDAMIELLRAREEGRGAYQSGTGPISTPILKRKTTGNTSHDPADLRDPGAGRDA